MFKIIFFIIYIIIVIILYILIYKRLEFICVRHVKHIWCNILHKRNIFILLIIFFVMVLLSIISNIVIFTLL